MVRGGRDCRRSTSIITSGSSASDAEIHDAGFRSSADSHAPLRAPFRRARLNCLDATFRSFEREVLPEARRRGIAVLGMKSLGGTGEVVKTGAATAAEALRYAMSLPVATTISGIETLDVLEQNLRVARGFEPMDDAEMEVLRDRCRTLAADGRAELFKTTMMFDAALGRGLHHFPSPEELPA